MVLFLRDLPLRQSKQISNFLGRNPNAAGVDRKPFRTIASVPSRDCPGPGPQRFLNEALLPICTNERGLTWTGNWVLLLQ